MKNKVHFGRLSWIGCRRCTERTT